MIVRIAPIVPAAAHYFSAIAPEALRSAADAPTSVTEDSGERTMEPLLVAIAGVPWQHWAVLAAAGWTLALVCFVGYHLPRRPASPAARAYLQLVRHRPPDDLRIEHDRLFHPRGRAA